ncbi:hypothetical protein [Salipaludibacillus sp. CF4.18]|uniref:hypothetical protein n=1 Tax=Salipaludibacillus sp. CF4.18 TaxID=3373081 RepID=UPI003EE53B7F
MFKKMIISMMIMSICLTGGLFFLLEHSEGVISDLQNNKVNGDLVKSFENKVYFYHLSKEEINEAIDRGTNSLELIENYLLPSQSQENNADVAFAYIETPYLTVMKESRAVYDHYGRKPVAEEMTERISDRYLPVHVRFSENKGLEYHVSFLQKDEEIEPITTEIQESGMMETIFIHTDDLDFASSATVRVEQEMNPGNEVEFEINFNNFIPK